MCKRSTTFLVIYPDMCQRPKKPPDKSGAYPDVLPPQKHLRIIRICVNAALDKHMYQQLPVMIASHHLSTVKFSLTPLAGDKIGVKLQPETFQPCWEKNCR